MSDRSAVANSPLSPCGRARAHMFDALPLFCLSANASAVRGKRLSRVKNDSPLTLPAMRLASQRSRREALSHKGRKELESLRNEDAQQRARQKKGGGRGGGKRERKERGELAIC